MHSHDDLRIRIPEPELMDEPLQAKAYAEADFQEANTLFLELFERYFPGHRPAHGLDIGCGPGEITLSFAERHPDCRLTGIDGAEAMLAIARRRRNRRPALVPRVDFRKARIPTERLPRRYDTILSNSLLHHLPDPTILWQEIRRRGLPGAAVLVMDLARPASKEKARELVGRYTAEAPEILRRDFYNSLCAAFTPAEIGDQLRAAGLENFRVEKVSDRHLAVHGRLA
ncbi:MAG: class I SAM-dependent methyltransferase [Methylohalobius crimeensis]